MGTVKVMRLSEAITALQAFKDRYGDLPMLNEYGGSYEFSAMIWNSADHLVAGENLQDCVVIDGVGVAGLPALSSASIPEGSQETMTLANAARLYDVKLSNLRLYCIRGTLKSVKVGKSRYVTRDEMDAVFKPTNKISKGKGDRS